MWSLFFIHIFTIVSCQHFEILRYSKLFFSSYFLIAGVNRQISNQQLGIQDYSDCTLEWFDTTDELNNVYKIDYVNKDCNWFV